MKGFIVDDNRIYHPDSFCPPAHKKPRIYKCGGSWRCLDGNGRVGIGETPEEAYNSFVEELGLQRSVYFD